MCFHICTEQNGEQASLKSGKLFTNRSATTEFLISVSLISFYKEYSLYSKRFTTFSVEIEILHSFTNSQVFLRFPKKSNPTVSLKMGTSNVGRKPLYSDAKIITTTSNCQAAVPFDLAYLIGPSLDCSLKIFWVCEEGKTLALDNKSFEYAW